MPSLAASAPQESNAQSGNWPLRIRWRKDQVGLLCQAGPLIRSAKTAAFSARCPLRFQGIIHRFAGSGLICRSEGPCGCSSCRFSCVVWLALGAEADAVAIAETNIVGIAVWRYRRSPFSPRPIAKEVLACSRAVEIRRSGPVISSRPVSAATKSRVRQSARKYQARAARYPHDDRCDGYGPTGALRIRRLFPWAADFISEERERRADRVCRRREVDLDRDPCTRSVSRSFIRNNHGVGLGGRPARARSRSVADRTNAPQVGARRLAGADPGDIDRVWGGPTSA